MVASGLTNRFRPCLKNKMFKQSYTKHAQKVYNTALMVANPLKLVGFNIIKTPDVTGELGVGGRDNSRAGQWITTLLACVASSTLVTRQCNQ